MANKRRPQGDGTIRKRNDGRWEARIIIGHKNDGSPMYKSAFTKTQKSALKQLHQLIDLYRDVDLTEDSRMTLGEWLDKWLDEYMIFTVRESTLDSYRAMVKNQVKPFIGGKQIASLTTADMQKFYNKIKKEGRVSEHPIHGKTLADSMVRGVHMMLHEALDTAVKERLLAKNPTNGTTVPKCNYPEKQILGDSQLDTFLEAIKGEEYWDAFFYVEVMTGLRRGEICGLKWQDINFEENKLQVKAVGVGQKGRRCQHRRDQNRNRSPQYPDAAERGRCASKSKTDGNHRMGVPEFHASRTTNQPCHRLPKAKDHTETCRTSADPIPRSPPHLCHACNTRRSRSQNAGRHSRTHKRQFHA